MQWFGDDLITYASLFKELQNFKDVNESLFNHNTFNSKTPSTAKDRINNVSARAKSLGICGLELLNQVSHTDRQVLILMSYLNLYRLSYEYVFELLVSRINEYEPVININEFENFYYDKQVLHPETLNLSRSTLRKFRSQIFNVLTSAGLLRKQKAGLFQLMPFDFSDELKQYLKDTPYMVLTR